MLPTRYLYFARLKLMVLNELPIDALRQSCEEQRAQYKRERTVDLEACLELFQRAVNASSQLAWTTLFEIYVPQMTRWVRGMAAFVYCDEDVDSCVNIIFWNFSNALKSKKLDRFKNRVPAIVQFLKTCCVNYVIACGRRRPFPEPLPNGGKESDNLSNGSSTDPEHRLIRQERQTQLDTLVANTLNDEREHVITELHFRIGLKSQTILSLYPDLFATVDEVYRVTENLKKRLGRNHNLRAMWSDGES